MPFHLSKLKMNKYLFIKLKINYSDGIKSNKTKNKSFIHVILILIWIKSFYNNITHIIYRVSKNIPLKYFLGKTGFENIEKKLDNLFRAVCFLDEQFCENFAIWPFPKKSLNVLFWRHSVVV